MLSRRFPSHEVGASFIKALGLPESTIWFELRVAIDEVITVKCEYQPTLSSDTLAEVVFSLHEYLKKAEENKLTSRP